MFTRYNTTTDALTHLKAGKVLQLGGFPKHIVNAYLAEDKLVFGFAEDEVQAKVKETQMPLAQLVMMFGNEKANKALAGVDFDLTKTSYDINLIASLGFNL
jgi:hypothetical protein